MNQTNSSPPTFDRRAIIAVGLTAALCWGFSFLSMSIFRDYALGLFVLLPLVLGATSTLIYGYNQSVARPKLFGISMWTLLVFCVGLLLFAWEGLICMLMGFPIGLLFTWIGHTVGYQILKSKAGSAPASIVLLFLSVPCLMAFENAGTETEEVRSVKTSIEINAPPFEVWKNVIAFPELADPTQLVFQTGIAYPINATLDGRGVGAVRHCNFSTGSFVEPITVWDEPNLLKFRVDEQPEPMKEISFYDIHPNHLHGYWVSKQGQFRLTRLPDGNTLLEGTTWYVNKIKPDLYWTIWSDYIVDKIHQRVLEHIKLQAEIKPGAPVR